MVLDKIYRTPVRPDVFREISQRGTGKKKSNAVSTSFVGFGVPDDTFILKKKIYNFILEGYDSIISQIAFDEEEELFQYDDLEMEVEEESIHVNNHKRKMMENSIDRDMKRPKQVTEEIQYPALLTQWYTYWSQKLDKGFLNDVPREYTSAANVPTMKQFMESKTGDAIIKFSRFISKQFI